MTFPPTNKLKIFYRCRGRIQQQEYDKKVFITNEHHTHLPISKRKYTLKDNSKLSDKPNMMSKMRRISHSPKTYK